MSCHFDGCENPVEHPEREDWYGLCDYHAKKQEKESVRKPLFTTKHYKAIAKFLNENYWKPIKTDDEVKLWVMIVVSLIKMFEWDNPKFSEKQFSKLYKKS